LVVAAALISSSRCVLCLTSASFWMALSWAWGWSQVSGDCSWVGWVQMLCRDGGFDFCVGLGVHLACMFLAKFQVSSTSGQGRPHLGNLTCLSVVVAGFVGGGSVLGYLRSLSCRISSLFSYCYSTVGVEV